MTIDIVNPEAVWTSRGTPGTRGECPECGGSVFRMGASHLHEGLTAPAPIHVSKRGAKPKLPPNTVYITYAVPDEETAQQLGDDLEKMGMTIWLHDHTPPDVNWAGGVHPALKECTRMVALLSDAALSDASNQDAWAVFRQNRKPLVVVQLTDIPTLPDELRRSTRFNMADDYRRTFRRLVQELAR